MTTKPEFTEHDILTACALRFDGYKYAEENGAVLSYYCQRLDEIGIDGLTDLERMAAFFAHQRYLCKWGGEALAKEGPTWKSFRELFLRVVECEVPKPYRFADNYYSRWREGYLPRIQECIAKVRDTHEATIYMDRDVSVIESKPYKSYTTIKALVMDFVHRHEGEVDYKKLTDEVLHYFPTSKWKATHWNYWRYQILHGKISKDFSDSEITNIKKDMQKSPKPIVAAAKAPIYPNLIEEEQKNIALALARVSHHVHPKIVERIRVLNSEYRDSGRLAEILPEGLNLDAWLYKGSAAVFPGVRRFVGKVKKKELLRFVPKKGAVIDDNRFPRNLWAFLTVGEPYNGPNWKSSGLSEFELAHIFAHKPKQRGLEEQVFKSFDKTASPFGLFTCAGNVVLIPKGFAKPTDGLAAVRVAFFKRYIDLYLEGNLPGLRDLDEEAVPEWYDELEWNEPILPPDWEENVKNLIEFRHEKLAKLFSAHK